MYLEVELLVVELSEKALNPKLQFMTAFQDFFSVEFSAMFVVANTGYL